MSELLPCPFCGGKQTYRKHDGGVWLTTTNHKRGCIMREALSFVAFDTEAEAIAAWNSRAERTCKEFGSVRVWQSCNVWSHELSCGHEVDTLESEPPNYCPYCGCKVVGE